MPVLRLLVCPHVFAQTEGTRRREVTDGATEPVLVRVRDQMRPAATQRMPGYYDFNRTPQTYV